VVLSQIVGESINLAEFVKKGLFIITIVIFNKPTLQKGLSHFSSNSGIKGLPEIDIYQCSFEGRAKQIVLNSDVAKILASKIKNHSYLMWIKFHFLIHFLVGTQKDSNLSSNILL